MTLLFQSILAATTVFAIASLAPLIVDICRAGQQNIACHCSWFDVLARLFVIAALVLAQVALA